MPADIQGGNGDDELSNHQKAEYPEKVSVDEKKMVLKSAIMVRAMDLPGVIAVMAAGLAAARAAAHVVADSPRMVSEEQLAAVNVETIEYLERWIDEAERCIAQLPAARLRLQEEIARKQSGLVVLPGRDGLLPARCTCCGHRWNIPSNPDGITQERLIPCPRCRRKGGKLIL